MLIVLIIIIITIDLPYSEKEALTVDKKAEEAAAAVAALEGNY